MADADPLFDRIMDSVRSRTPGAVDSNVWNEAAPVLEEFFRISTCWREKLLVPVIADTQEYELEGLELPSRVDALYHFTDTKLGRYNAVLTSDRKLYITTQPEPGDYYAWVVLNVTARLNDNKYPRFPQWVSDRYGDYIADGITARLMAMPAKPYSNPTMAAYHSRRFKAGAQTAKMETSRGNLMGGQNWRFPYFGTRR